MKAIKTLLAASALTTIASAASATIWPITMSTNVNIDTAGGPFIVNYMGFYDDDATQLGHVGGQIFISGFLTTINYTDQTFTMDPTSGEGFLDIADSSVSNCTANTANACAGFSPSFKGSLYNDINFSYDTDDLGNKTDTSTGTPFSPYDNAFTWSLVITYSNNGVSDLVLIPFTVNLQAYPEVPIPAAAWLFGSGLIGLAGAARKRKFA